MAQGIASEEKVSEGLKFTINPENQAASVDLFVKALDDIRRLLNGVTYAIYRERTGRRWVIEGLHSSSPTVTVNPLLGGKESSDAVARGIGAVTSGTDQPPEYFPEPVLNDLRRMRRLFRGRDRARSVEVVLDNEPVAEIQKDITRQVDRILTAGYWNLGSLEGALEAVNFHGTPNFTIWDRVSRAPVRCSLPSQGPWKEQAKALLEKRVRVRGRIRYFANGVPRSMVDLLSLQDATPDPSLPKAEFGSIPDPEAARDPVAFLRAVRGMDGNS